MQLSEMSMSLQRVGLNRSHLYTDLIPQIPQDQTAQQVPGFSTERLGSGQFRKGNYKVEGEEVKV